MEWWRLAGEQEKGLVEADAEARRAIEGRIFIAHELYAENVLERWQLLAGARDWNKMVGHWESLHGTLILAAHKDLGIRELHVPFWRRWFRRK